MAREDPDRNLGFLLIEVTRLLRKDFERRVRTRDLALTQIQWRAIANLSRSEGITQVVLADRLEIKPITMTRLIDRLAGAGWVERRPDPTDRRAVRLYLTDEAQPLVKQLQLLAAGTRDTALAGLSAAARRELLDALQHMKSNLLSAQEQDTASARSTLKQSGRSGADGKRRPRKRATRTAAR